MALAVISTAFFLLSPSLAAATAGGQISGKVTKAGGGAAIEEIEVCAYEPGGGYGGCSETNAGGEYTISGLASGSYKVEFSPGYFGRY